MRQTIICDHLFNKYCNYYQWFNKRGDITSHHKGGFNTNLVKNCKPDAFRKIMELIVLCMRVYFSLLFLNNYQDITSHHKGGFDTNLVKNCKLDAFRKIMELIMLCMRVYFSLLFFNNYQLNYIINKFWIFRISIHT